MKPLKSILVVPIVTLGLSACDTLNDVIVDNVHSAYTADNILIVRNDSGKTAGDQIKPFDIETDCVIGQSIYDTNTQEFTCPGNKSTLSLLNDAIREGTAKKDDQATLRNAIIDEIILLSNRRCERFKTLLTGLDASRNLLSGLTAAGLSGAASVVTGGASNILSLTSSLVTGANAQVRSEFMNNQITAVIRNEIDKNRETAMNLIRSHKKEEYKDYSIVAALIDLDTYHRKCSLDSALASLGGGTDSKAYLQNEIYAAEARIAVLNQQLQSLHPVANDETDTSEQATTIQKEIGTLRARTNELSIQLHGVPLAPAEVTPPTPPTDGDP
jgi:hypothetical protein